MTTPVTLRIQQKGYIRPEGYQAIQWAVTVPISVPPGSPPIATDPSYFAYMFVVRQVGGFETFERVATLLDVTNLPPCNIVCLDLRGVGGDVALASVVPGQTVGFTNPPSTWLTSEAPYTDTEFAVLARQTRASGGDASCGPVGLVIPSYNFSPDDIGRWVYLSNFTDPGNNGWARIVSYLGNVAQVDRTFTSPGVSGNWAFYFVKIDPSAVPAGVEPKYFPTAAANLTWKLMQGATMLATGNSGVTFREPSSTPLSLTTRFTQILPTAQAVEDLFLVSRQQVDALQRAATQNQTAFLNTITHTIGP